MALFSHASVNVLYVLSYHMMQDVYTVMSGHDMIHFTYGDIPPPKTSMALSMDTSPNHSLQSQCNHI